MFFSHKSNNTNIIPALLTIVAILVISCISPLTVHATEQDYLDAAEERKSLAIQSNEIENWPVGPKIGAESAILMDVDTGVILYAKNIHTRLAPASTTKLVTCLLAMENGSLDDMVPFSYEAVFSVPSDGSNIGMDVGQSITLEQCLYGILVGSANEVANAVAEYTAGSIEAFVDMMNDYAASLGCKDTHFVNTNGLYDENHYTSVYDLAIMSRAFFQNEMLCKIGNTARYHFEPTSTQPDDFYLNNKHQLITGEIPVSGVLGGKTGYTDEARQTLVTCAEQNGMRLICIVFKEESPNQFLDTAELFQYGFSNFQVENISENERKYDLKTTGFLQVGIDIFGSSKSLLSVDTKSYVIVPNTITFDELTSEIVYDMEDNNHVARINYSYQDTYVGNAYIELACDSTATYTFETSVSEADTQADMTDNAPIDNTIFINVKKVLIFVIALALVVIVIVVVRNLLSGRRVPRVKRERPRKNRRRHIRNRSGFNDFDF